jgi:hypothetical protein
MAEVEATLGLEAVSAVADRTPYSKPCTVDTAALLFPHCPTILMALHLVYEVSNSLQLPFIAMTHSPAAIVLVIFFFFFFVSL